MTTLEDMPCGLRLVESLTQAIKDLSLLFANAPDEQAQASLTAYLDRIEPALVESVGAENAEKIREAFASTVMTEKRKIEAAGASRA